ncbi:unnamed protein product [Prunus brigantina]
MARRRQNRLMGLEDATGVWYDKETDIHAIAVSYFQDLFTTSRPSRINETVDCVHQQLTASESSPLIKPVTRDEVLDTVKSLSPSASPGPDGFTGAFFHHHWSVVGDDVFQVVQSFFHSGKLPRRLNLTHITLIPKVLNPRNMKQWRPISLCNVIYKFISKILSNRLKSVLPLIISPHQSAFVAERQITDNILVVHEILHSLQKGKRSDPKTLALKLDMAKAFDRVEWPFLIAMMKKLGFPYQFCSWIFECISTVSYSVLINGAPIGKITPSRGLRQGDPLSPFLFLICAEGLTSLIKAHEARQALHGFQLRRDEVSISHLLFADDSVLFCEADAREAECVLNILQCYEAGSGQSVNFDKSSIFYSAHCSSRLRVQMEQILHIKGRKDFGKYLGIMADFGTSKRKVFEEVRRKLDGKLLGWAEQFLSPAGKEVLIKAVAMALPCYAMSCFKLPVTLCKGIEAAMARFWWKSHTEKNGIHWVSWAKLSQLKKAGGLGFRDLQCFNMALLAKIGWRIVNNPSSLLACLLHDKYFVGATFLTATSQKSSSWGWKGILQGRRLLESGLRWRIGDGTSVQVRKDPWLPTPYTFRTLSRHPDLPSMVHELIDPLLKIWKEDVINRCFTPEEASRILSIPISRWGCPDKLIWHFTMHGQYTVRSCYELALHLQRNGELGRKGAGEASGCSSQTSIWKSVWLVDAPPKLKAFIWRGCSNILAVRHNLRRRRVQCTGECGFCGLHDETQVHIFFQCPFARAFWFASPLQLDVNNLAGEDFISTWQHMIKMLNSSEHAAEAIQWFVFGLWRIWKARNSAVFDGVQADLAEVVLLLAQAG